MTAPFADRFARARSTSIEVEGEPVYSVVELDLQGPVTLVVIRVRSRPDRAQGLVIDGGETQLTVGVVDATRLTLWSDTSPEKVAVGVKQAGPVKLRMWNTWRDGAVEHAWVGWAGIKRDDFGGLTLLSCSDGFDDGGFDDLVLELKPGHGSGAFTTALH